MPCIRWSGLWAVAVVAVAAGAEEVRLSREALPIPFYSGNLSVGRFMHLWGTHPASAEPWDRSRHDIPLLDAELVDQLHRTGCDAMTDYICWSCVEREEGVWDWSYYAENARAMREAGTKYAVFCWLHFPPAWYEESGRFVQYRNVETGAEIPQISLWSPDLPRVYDEFYRRLAEAIGEEVAFVRLAMPSEYGELGYCAGMTDWLRPQPGAGPGFWCGDEHAQAAFRRDMLERHGSRDALNEAWGTAFDSDDAIAMPLWRDVSTQIGVSAPARRRWVDFVSWYHEAWSRTLEQTVAIVRRHFPAKEIVASLGYGSERACYGNDQSRLIAKMAELGVSSQSPGAIACFPTRRVSSACRLYGVPYCTEPPGDVPREAQLDRIYMDLTNGVQVWFDYLPNLDRARDLFAQYAPLLTGAPPRTTVAVWHPTLDHWLHPLNDWSPATEAVASALRARMDYEIVDDRMILDGALDRLGVRALALAGAEYLDDAAWRRVQSWMEAGGVLLVGQSGVASSIQGDPIPWVGRTAAPSANLSDVVRLAFPTRPDAYRVDVADLRQEALLTGPWYQPERPRWCAPGGGVILPTPDGGTLQISVVANLHPEAEPVRLLVDGREMAVATPGHQGELRFEFAPAPHRERAHALLTFEGEGWVPAEVSGSPDTRRLCLYVTEIRVAVKGAADAELAEAPVPVVDVDMDALWQRSAVRVGQGAVVVLDRGKAGAALFAAVAGDLFERAGTLMGRPERNAPRIGSDVPGVLACMTEPQILYYNTTQSSVVVRPDFRLEDFGGRRPELPPEGLAIPPRTIVAVPVSRG